MKKVVFSLLLGILLIGLVSVMAQGDGKDSNDTEVCDSDNLELCTGNNDCIGAGGYWYNGICNEEEQEDEGGESQGLGQTIRNRVTAGVYTSSEGEQIRVSELSQDMLRFRANGIEVHTGLNITSEQIQNRTRLGVQLSNRRNAEIKVMPDVASERALERLKLKVCSEENNCTIELKETGVGNQTKVAYEVQAQRHFRILGLFRAKAQVRAQVDAESGEIIRVKKPWWAFLATEGDES